MIPAVVLMIFAAGFTEDSDVERFQRYCKKVKSIRISYSEYWTALPDRKERPVPRTKEEELKLRQEEAKEVDRPVKDLPEPRFSAHYDLADCSPWYWYKRTKVPTGQQRSERYFDGKSTTDLYPDRPLASLSKGGKRLDSFTPLNAAGLRLPQTEAMTLGDVLSGVPVASSVKDDSIDGHPARKLVFGPRMPKAARHPAWSDECEVRVWFADQEGLQTLRGLEIDLGVIRGRRWIQRFVNSDFRPVDVGDGSKMLFPFLTKITTGSRSEWRVESVEVNRHTEQSGFSPSIPENYELVEANGRTLRLAAPAKQNK